MATLTREMIINTVREWSIEEQIEVMQDILQLVKSENQNGNKKRIKTLDQALGIAATGHPAPDDETVQQWRRERVEEKYGC